MSLWRRKAMPMKILRSDNSAKFANKPDKEKQVDVFVSTRIFKGDTNKFPLQLFIALFRISRMRAGFGHTETLRFVIGTTKAAIICIQRHRRIGILPVTFAACVCPPNKKNRN